MQMKCSNPGEALLIFTSGIKVSQKNCLPHHGINPVIYHFQYLIES